MENTDSRNNTTTVLVTGGSGFLGVHCILKLIESGYKVRTTVRSLNREASVREMLMTGGIEAGDKLSFAEADLLSDNGWAEAASGCEYVLHVASPFPVTMPKDENELIAPAREGALRVLKAARDARVKRLVLTSSFAAIGYGAEPTDVPFNEENWTDPNRKNISAYVKSKTLAERAAWDFMAKEGGTLELSVVNPVGILGPALNTDISTSILIIKRLMDGSVPACPRVSFGLVDVRDVADLHVSAMTNPAAKGQRFLAVAGKSLAMTEVAKILKARMGEAAQKVPTRSIPDWLLKMYGLFDREVAQLIPELGKVKQVSNEKAKRMLGWNPRSNEEAIVATAESLLKLGMLGGGK